MKPLIKNKNKINNKNPNNTHFTPLYCCLWMLLSFKYIKTMMIIKVIANKMAKIVCPCENMLINFSTNLSITTFKI